MTYSDTDERILAEAHHILETKGTVRSTAKKFGVSKSTVHKDLSQKLFYINERLFTDVKKLLGENLSERHLRGGEATKRKYKALKHNSFTRF